MGKNHGIRGKSHLDPTLLSSSTLLGQKNPRHFNTHLWEKTIFVVELHATFASLIAHLQTPSADRLLLAFAFSGFAIFQM
jgi:hypothetical protein